jgi:hypothetical protein
MYNIYTTRIMKYKFKIIKHTLIKYHEFKILRMIVMLCSFEIKKSSHKYMYM